MRKLPDSKSKPSRSNGKNETGEVMATGKTVAALRREAAACKACDLWKTGTQTVFGDGASAARIMFVGEQPGDQEDREGHPFVGPAGKILHKAMQEAGIDESEVYVTNAVKHFKWSPGERGRRRIHKKPRYSEIHACRPWLDAELRIVRPQVLVCLGATAAQSLLGRDFSVSRLRGQLIESALAPIVTATVHPSSILRAPDDDSRRAQMSAFVEDLRKVAHMARRTAAWPIAT
jgi:uracil-DNA glycosylase family protein